jgi:hypothetical protein
MKPVTYFSTVMFALLVICSCKDFVNRKITNDNITVLLPSNNTVTTSNAITFWWQKLDGADNYNIQIVKPNFAAAQEFIADTTVTGTRFQLSLAPGIYQWRIRGNNGGGSTQFTTFNLTIDTTSDLGSLLVVPIGPAPGFVNGAGAVTFSWNAIAAAEKYNLYINSNPVVDVIITSTSFTSTFSPNTYTWKVKAMNAFSVSQFNVPRSFKIDLTGPGIPNNLAVSGSLNTKVTDTLKWKRNGADVSFDSLYIYEDSGMSSVNTAAIVNTTKVTIGTFLSAPSSSFTPYWWRIKSIDSVGNRSNFSALTAFTLTP